MQSDKHALTHYHMRSMHVCMYGVRKAGKKGRGEEEKPTNQPTNVRSMIARRPLCCHTLCAHRPLALSILPTPLPNPLPLSGGVGDWIWIE